MEQLLQRAGSQAVTFAIRSGISIASGYAFKTLTRFIDKVPEKQTLELDAIQRRLHTKIQVIVPAIDLIELIASRGNTSLDHTLVLTRELKQDVDEFDQRVETETEAITAAKSVEGRNLAIAHVKEYMQDLLHRIEDAIPLITLAITTSGANLTASLPDYVSPGRLLQATNMLTTADAQFTGKEPINVGPEFQLIYYSIFYSTARTGNAANDITWKEEYARCRAQLVRIPSKEKYDYELRLTEDFDDSRYHDDDEKPRTRNIDVRVITRLFFTASGRLLEIPDSRNPVLVLKLNKIFDDPKPKERVTDSAVFTRGPSVEWMAFEKYEGDDDDVDEYSDSDEDSEPAGLDEVTGKMAGLSLQPPAPGALSILEYLLRLTALQANDQASVLTIHDERLSLYLRDEAHGSSVAADNDESVSPRAARSANSSPFSARTSPFSSHSARARSTPSPLGRRSGGSTVSHSPRSPARSQLRSPNRSVYTPSRQPRKKPTVPLTPWEQDRIKLRPSLATELDAQAAVSPFRGESPVKKDRRRDT